MPFEKLPGVKGRIKCLTMGLETEELLHLDRHIAVGFGSAGYSKDTETLWDEGQVLQDDEDEYNVPTVREVEALAAADPDHDWRIWFYAPLYEEEYQRQGPEVWVLVRCGQGFA